MYIGESNNIIQRTKQHFEYSDDELKWQHQLSRHPARLYIIGHEHFNKSLTLDIENRLMLYIDRIKKIHNQRGNPQNKYYPVDELDDIFRQIFTSFLPWNSAILINQESAEFHLNIILENGNT